jgi:hypothetical protein
MNREAVSVLFLAVCLIFLAFNVSAGSRFEERINKPYIRNFDIWEYKEDLYGHNQGFVLKHIWRSPTYKYEYIDREYDFDTYNGVKWRRYYNRGYHNQRHYPDKLSYAFKIYRSRGQGHYSRYRTYSYYGHGYYHTNYW